MARQRPLPNLHLCIGSFRTSLLNIFAFYVLVKVPATVAFRGPFIVATKTSTSRRPFRTASSSSFRLFVSPSTTSTMTAASSSSSTTMTSLPSHISLKPYIETLIAGERSLTREETKEAFAEILRGADEVQVGSLLTLLRARGETSHEIAGMVQAMNEACRAVPLPPSVKLLDIVGTGGDGADTINISTASVVLAAACGCIVAKAGNRSVSSRCGSADVLEALGVVVDLDPDQVVACVEQCRVAFMFAPVNHPAMKYVAPVRKRLGVRTCFNLLGPMTNAAGAQHAVIGVFEPELCPIMANALKEVGRVEHVVIIHGVGLDEISPLGPATILEIKNTAPPGSPKVYEERQFEFDPLDVGIPRCELIDLRGGNPDENAEAFRQVLLGGSHTDAKRDAIVLNAGVGCYVYGLTNTIADGIQLARTTLESGKAAELMKTWIQVSQSIAGTTP